MTINTTTNRVDEIHRLPQGVSVVIPHGGRARLPHLAATLANLRQCHEVGEIIVVELGETPCAQELARRWSDKYLFAHHSGPFERARALASALGLDLYRLDLASLVSKYIGETEKNLSQVFARAEELGVILLLDEGDALLTNRTSVHTSNDRYANLETNYLLQRLESYDGLLIITTNAGDRIDGAFQRRMDVIIQFRAPEAAERQTIWELHLPPAHAIDPAFMREVAYRCDLTGGQIRNAALHASLLALDDGGVVTTHYLEAAVQREYRKLGTVCPLRRRV